MMSQLQIGRIEVRSIETPLTDHCNLKCAGCDHASPHMGASFLDVDSLADDLTVLSSAMKAEEFRLVGGEPLQHPDLSAIIDVIRGSGIARNIVLITNGLLLHRAEPHIWQSIDKLWLSIYPNVKLKLSREEIEAICREYDVVFEPRPTQQFRRVLLSRAIADTDLVQRIYDDCKAAHVWKCYTVSKGRFSKCAKPALIKERLALTGTDYVETSPDGVDLHSGWFLRQRLRRYLASETPLGTCRYCLGTAGQAFDHHQMGRDELANELVANQDEALEFVRAKLMAEERRSRARRAS